MEVYIKKFSSISINDVPEVGGKNASLGEMFSQLSSKGISVPDGFAVTAYAYRHFIAYNKLDGVHKKVLEQLERPGYSNLGVIGKELRELTLMARMPNDLADLILEAYRDLSKKGNGRVAVRSSATAEDLPTASFAGQHESYLNIYGPEALLTAVQKCFASLYTDRAIKYREDQGFEHDKVLLSVGVQTMVPTDKACSGIGFTLEPESGFRQVVHLSGVWGLGENIVQGSVTPDEFLLFKPALKWGKMAILQKKLGGKSNMMIYGKENAASPTENIETPEELREKFVLTDEEITTLGKWAITIEDHYQKPMDIEWAKDGDTGKLFILQARPETVFSTKKSTQITEYKLKEKGELITAGEAIGSKVTSGRARILASPAEADKLEVGDVVVTEMTSPDWDPILKKVSAIVTNKGGRTSHASIVARELGVPAIVGTENATMTIRDGEMITVSCAEGKRGNVYRNALKWEEIMHDFSQTRLPVHPEVKLILGEPEKAFQLASYPCNGIGLMRLEFIISHYVQIHPMALVKFHEVKDEQVRQTIEALTHHYPDKEKYFVEKLAEGVATIAAAFYPEEVIVRMSDFKTNEYANLVGGRQFEPVEENPMLGFRGASRYYHDLYKEGFRLECEAMKRVRKEMGLTNVKLMIPFCRTPEEGRKVVDLMANYGLIQGENELEIYVMAEIPSNVLLAEEFAAIFDGFSI
ncbi:MAG TPA: phosphoenolpyruvate synthase, partial [Sphingobacteriaceae bacterium]